MARVTIDEARLKEIIRDVIDDRLKAVGLNATDPDHAEDIAANLRFLATVKRAVDASAATIGKAILLAFVGIFLSIMALGGKLYLWDHISSVKSGKP